MNEEACLQYLKWMAIPGLYAPVDVRTLDDDKDDEIIPQAGHNNKGRKRRLEQDDHDNEDDEDDVEHTTTVRHRVKMRKGEDVYFVWYPSSSSVEGNGAVRILTKEKKPPPTQQSS